MKDNKSGKILNVLLSILALVAIIFIIFWLITKNNSTINANNSFSDSLEKMQETAKEYFKDNLPEDVGDTTIIYLDEMIEKDLSKTIKYGKITCDENLSYISATRSANNEYKVKSNLVCGNVSDNLIEKISIKSIIKNNDGEIIKEEDGNIKDTIKGNNKDNLIQTGSCDCGDEINCNIYEVPTKCTTEYTYEFVKYNISCPEGYILNNGTCQRVTNDTTNAQENWSEGTTKVTDAKKNDGDYHKVYTDYLISGGKETKYCEKGTLMGDYCYEYSEKIIKEIVSCPDGYVREGNACYKHAELIKESESYCPSGYEKKNNACYKYADLITDETESCPSGYTLSNGMCYKYAEPIKNTTGKTCPSGYTQSGSGNNITCYKTTEPKKSYSPWGNPVREYSTTKPESTYETDTEKKVLMGTNTIKGVTTYNYAIYRRTVSYTCSNGTLQNGKCYIYTSPIGGSTTYTCPSGYTQDGNTCYIAKRPTTSSNSYCPYGYTRSGNTCYKKTDLIYSSDSHCPAGYTRNGNDCYIKTDLIRKTESSCPSGFTETNGKCLKVSKALVSTTEKVYYCPDGYTKEGDKEKTKCYKLVKSSDTYYCEDEKATLKGTLCYYREESKFIGYSCPYGYTLDGTTCYRTTTETTNPIWSNPEYKYSKDKYLPGYQRTGRATYVTTCVEIEDYNGQDPSTMK